MSRDGLVWSFSLREGVKFHDGSPLTATDAAVRSSMEPLVEMNQHKGDSECRPGVQSTDEICGFEKLNRLQLFSPVSNPNQTFPPLNYVRNALKEGSLSPTSQTLHSVVVRESLLQAALRFGWNGAKA